MIYLDNAATSWPKPKPVYQEIMNCMKNYCANPGRSGHRMAIKASEKIYECRENLGKLFNIENPLNIIFTGNTTESLNIGIKGLLGAGDHVIITSMEHNSVLRPLKKMEEKGLSLSIVQGDSQGKIDPNKLLKQIRSNTKLIVTIHASNVCGTVNPVKEIGRIAKQHGILYMVDCAQTAGTLAIDVNEMNIDLLAFPGHKGLLGPQGVGGLYIREGIKLDSLKEGGTGSLSESPYQPDFNPDQHESGTLNTPGIVGLSEGVKYILKVGINQIEEYEKELTKHLLEGLLSIKNIKIYGIEGLEQRVGVVAFNIQGKDCIEVCTMLDEEYRIASRGGLHCAYLAHKTLGTLETGAVRLSVGLFNTKKDITKALEAINKIAKF